MKSESDKTECLLCKAIAFSLCGIRLSSFASTVAFGIVDLVVAAALLP